jgi:hypothetical protein
VRRLLLVAGVLLVAWAGEAQAETPAASWTVLPSPPVPGTSLLVVSCYAARSCIFGGFVQPEAFPAVSVVARLTGRSWQPLAAPGDALDALSCPSPKDCEAIVGLTPSRWDGSRWIAQLFPLPSTGGSPFTVTCLSPTDCFAVGSIGSITLAGESPLIEHWNGQVWRRQPLREPPYGGALFAVSCSGPYACTAVGGANTPRNNTQFSRSIAYRYNGTRWTLTYPPNPAGPYGGTLWTVSCPSAHLCVAPSHTPDSRNIEQAFADVWRDGRWHATRFPLPAAAIRTGTSWLSAVSCMSTRACVAVGTWSPTLIQLGLGGGTALIEEWNGTAWHRLPQPLPLPAEGAPGSGTLTAISCGSTTTCTAAGSYTTTTGATRVLVERLSLG